jgi:tRNA (mo5U34)-methyltransferase
VAALLPIDADELAARRALDSVPLWFHTFALNGALHTPGVARDHRYRIPHIPDDFSGLSVLDVGAFDGFYAFLAERRGAERVVAVDNEQYRAWVRDRWGIELRGGEGFRAIHRLLGSRVEYRRIDAFDLELLGERFDLVLCFGILHRVESPLGLLRVLRACTQHDGRMLLETYGARTGELEAEAGIHVCEPGEVYANDDYVYWGFTGQSLDRLARLAEFEGARVLDAPVIDRRPRIIAELDAAAGGA